MTKIRHHWFPLVLILCALIALVPYLVVYAQVSPQITGSGSPTNPCANGGQFYLDTTNHVNWLCPSSGSNWVNTQVTTSGVTPGMSMQGTAAAGAAPVGNPVQVGGSDGSNMRTLQTGSSGLIALGSNGMVTFGMPAANIVGPAWTGQAYGTNSALASAMYTYNGTTLDTQFYCPNTTTIPSTANTTSAILVAASGATKIRICSFIMSGNATAGSMDLVYGTTAACASGTTTLTGTINVLGTTAPPVVFASGATGALTTPASQAICARATTTTVTGSFTWAQF